MDNFDQSTYQGAFGVHGNLNVEHPIVKRLTDPETPVDEAKHHFDRLHEISTRVNSSGFLELGNASKNLHIHFLHPTTPWNYRDEGNGTFLDHVVDSALNSENQTIFHLGAMSKYLQPKHLEKAINSKFLDSMPSYFTDIPGGQYDHSPFKTIISKVSRANTSDATRKILVDKILNVKYGSELGTKSDYKKIVNIGSLTPVLSNENMHYILDSKILDESNATASIDNNFRLRALEAIAKHGDDSVRDKLLEKHKLLDENEDGTLGIQTDKDTVYRSSYNPQSDYISSMLKYGNNEQQNKILINLKNKNYKNTKNFKLNEAFSAANNEQRHYMIANFHPHAFDLSTTGDGGVVVYHSNPDHIHHLAKRYNELNIKMPVDSVFRLRKSFLHKATQQLILENDKIKES